MPLVNFTNLDYTQIKTSLIDYLRSNSNFTDYDFEGSNLSTIIDVLAYNTYITSYNANMVSNEVFIDSATLRENVVSLARNIGYVPVSKTSARANISFYVDTSDFDTKPATLTLNKGLLATSQFSQTGTFTFSLLEDITVPVGNNIAYFNNVLIHEGTYLTTNFTKEAGNPNQRFILPNSGIDTSTVKVTLYQGGVNSTVTRTYKQADSLFNIDGTSPVYWIQEVEGERYELIFGDGVFGKKLENGDYLEVSYLVSSGADGNNLASFIFSGKITSSRDTSSIISGISLLTTITASFGGKNIETIESIKKYASRIYASQNRAVTAADYEAIIPTVYPETESVSVFGGEELTPPRFGKVYISVKPINGAYLSNLMKDNIKRDLRQYAVAGITPEIIDLKYLYIEPTVNVYYNTNLAPNAASVTTIVSKNIEQYGESTELNKFGARFKYSKFLTVIDESDEAITSNITTIVMRRDLRAALNSFAEYEICFGNRFHIKNELGYNIKTSGFNVSGILGTVYLGDLPNENMETGSIVLFKLDDPTKPTIVKQNVGTIDYVKGEIILSPINITNTLINRGFPLIEISISPYSNDVIGLQDLYLQLDNSKTVISSKPDNIESGLDITGTTYLVSSSHANGLYVR